MNFESVISISKYVWRRAIEERVTEAAAASAFYSILSIFPLLLLVISSGSYFFDNEVIREQVLETISKFIPQASQQIIRANIIQILAYRGRVSMIGVILLAWSASGVFNTIQMNLSRAWPHDPLRHILKARLFSLLMVVAFFFLLIVFLLIQTAAVFFATFLKNIPVLSYFANYSTQIGLYIFTFLAFVTLYKWVPKSEIKWSEALGGALAATFLSVLMTGGYGWFLSSGLNRYNLVYGSLGALVGFMFWLFFIHLVILAGGHISAAMAKELRGFYKHRSP